MTVYKLSEIQQNNLKKQISAIIDQKAVKATQRN